MGHTVAVAALGVGASIVETHFTLNRSDPCPDILFSTESAEFLVIFDAIPTTEATLGGIRHEPTPAEGESRRFCRLVFVTCDVEAGESFTHDNVGSVRPAAGLSPKHQSSILGKIAACDSSLVPHWSGGWYS